MADITPTYAFFMEYSVTINNETLRHTFRQRISATAGYGSLPVGGSFSDFQLASKGIGGVSGDVNLATVSSEWVLSLVNYYGSSFTILSMQVRDYFNGFDGAFTFVGIADLTDALLYPNVTGQRVSTNEVARQDTLSLITADGNVGRAILLESPETDNAQLSLGSIGPNKTAIADEFLEETSIFQGKGNVPYVGLTVWSNTQNEALYRKRFR